MVLFVEIISYIMCWFVLGLISHTAIMVCFTKTSEEVALFKMKKTFFQSLLLGGINLILFFILLLMEKDTKVGKIIYNIIDERIDL